MRGPPVRRADFVIKRTGYALVTVLVAVLTFAVLKFLSAARQTRGRLRENGMETTFLSAALQEAVSDPTIIKTWDTEGFFIYPKEQRTATFANSLLKSEIERWGQVIRDNNIHVDQ